MQTMKTSLLSIVAALNLLAACNQKAETSKVNIVRGHKLDADSPARHNVVGLSNDGRFIFCTGSIVAEDMVVTAAHCVRDQSKPLKVVLGEPGQLQTIDVEAIETYKSYKEAAFPNFDIAWLKLKSPVSADWKPVEVLRDPSLLKQAEELRLAGYGIEKTGCQADDCHDELLEARTELRDYYDEPRLMSLLVFKGAGDKGFGASCNGDSGGPAYAKIKGAWYLIGVTNGATNYINPDSFANPDKSCEEGSDIYTFMGDYVSWMESRSNRQLLQSQDNPLRKTLSTLARGELLPPGTPVPTSWGEWLQFPYHNEEAWNSVNYLLNILNREQSRKIRAKDLDAPKVDELIKLFTNPEYSTAQFQKMKTLRLAPGKKDAQRFVGQAFDMRPVTSLKHLEELNLAAEGVLVLQSLDQMPQLKSLVIDIPEKDVATIDLSLLKAAPQLERLTLTHVAPTALNAIPWGTMTALHNITLKVVPAEETVAVDLSQVPALETLKVIDWPTIIPLKLAPGIKLKQFSSSGKIIHWNWLNLADIQSIDNLTLARESLNRPNLVQAFQGKRLIRLEAPYNGLTDASLTASGFAELQDLQLFGNQISDSAFLKNLPALKTADLRSNPLQNAECPEGVSCRFDRILHPATPGDYCLNAVTDAEDESGQTYSYVRTVALLLQSQKLDVTNISVESCQTLQTKLAQTTELKIDGDLIMNLLGEEQFDGNLLRTLTQLTDLSMNDIALIQADIVGSLTALKSIDLNGVKIATLDFVSKLPVLDSFDFFNYPFSNLEQLSSQSLTSLHLSSMAFLFMEPGKLETIGAVNMPKLKSLSVAGQPLKNLQGIERLTSLESLFMRETKITDLSPLSSLMGTTVYMDAYYQAETCPVTYGTCYYDPNLVYGRGIGEKAGETATRTAFYSGQTLPGLTKTLQF